MSLPLDFGALGAAMERVEMERRAGVKRTPEETKAAIRAALAAGPTGPTDHGALIAAADRYAAAYVAHETATVARRAAYDVWRAATKQTGALDAAWDAAVEAQRVARAEMDAALAGLERAARGER